MKAKDRVGCYQSRPEGRQSPPHPFILDYWVHRSPDLSHDFLIPFRNIAGISRRIRARRIIDEMLGQVGIRMQKRLPLVGKIYSEATRLAKESNAGGKGEYKRIPIMVEIRRVYGRTFSHDIDFVLEEDMGVPANRSAAIDGLARVRVKETKVCAVCLEEMEAGPAGTMMPCKHIFHGRCIYTWLEKANSCPLCRFQFSHRRI